MSILCQPEPTGDYRYDVMTCCDYTAGLVPDLALSTHLRPDPSPRLLPSAASYRLAVLAGRCDEEVTGRDRVPGVGRESQTDPI